MMTAAAVTRLHRLHRPRAPHPRLRPRLRLLVHRLHHLRVAPRDGVVVVVAVVAGVRRQFRQFRLFPRFRAFPRFLRLRLRLRRLRFRLFPRVVVAPAFLRHPLVLRLRPLQRLRRPCPISLTSDL